MRENIFAYRIEKFDKVFKSFSRRIGKSLWFDDFFICFSFLLLTFLSPFSFPQGFKLWVLYFVISDFLLKLLNSLNENKLSIYNE